MRLVTTAAAILATCQTALCFDGTWQVFAYQGACERNPQKPSNRQVFASLESEYVDCQNFLADGDVDQLPDTPAYNAVFARGLEENNLELRLSHGHYCDPSVRIVTLTEDGCHVLPSGSEPVAFSIVDKGS